MKHKAGIVFMVIGASMFFGAVALFLYNNEQAQLAQLAAAETVPKIQQQIPQQPADESLAKLLIPPEMLDEESIEMTQVVIDGHAYIGYISIPSLQLDLPVMADWNAEKLKISPCRYTGSVLGNNMVVMAHNYRRHFSRISTLENGDEVLFADMDGIVTRYEVAGRDVLAATAIEEMTCGYYDLVLFSCTYDGQSRVTVYCNKTEKMSF